MRYSFLGCALEAKCGAEVFADGESDYSGMGIKKSANEFSGDGNNSDGANMFSGSTLISNNNEGEFAILHFYLIGRTERENL